MDQAHAIHRAGLLRTLAFLAVLSPLLLSSSGQSCNRVTGDTTLTLLELEVLGQNRIAFAPALRVYDLWLPAAASSLILRVQSTDPAASVTWQLPDSSGSVGVGGGELTLDIPADGLALFVLVRAPGGAFARYTITFNPVCPEGDPCSNGGTAGTCVNDVCQTASSTGVLEVNGTFNQCAQLQQVLPVGSALQAPLGGTIDLEAYATDGEDDAIDYTWTATAGSFTSSSNPLTTYSCDDPGTQVIELWVTDDGFDNCVEEWSMIVVCGSP